MLAVDSVCMQRSTRAHCPAAAAAVDGKNIILPSGPLTSPHRKPKRVASEAGAFFKAAGRGK